MAEVKHEWRKKEKKLYVPKQSPVQLEVPEFKYIVLEGVGNPNDEELHQRDILNTPCIHWKHYGNRRITKKSLIKTTYSIEL